MTQLEILKYAQRGAADIWGKTYDQYMKNREDATAKAEYEKADKILTEIQTLLAAEIEKKGGTHGKTN